MTLVTTPSRSLVPFFLLIGFVCGFFLATALNKETAVLIARFVLALSIVTGALCGKQIEAALHARDLDNWEEIRTRHKWRFITIRYALLRGIVLFALFIFPLLLTVRFSSLVFIASAAGFALLALALAYFGGQEWTTCEREYAIRLLKKTGEQLRTVQN